MILFPILFFLVAPALTKDAVSPAPVVFIIQSQPGTFHTALAEESKQSILTQWKKYVPDNVMTPPIILFTHEMEDNIPHSAWTLFPLIEVFASYLSKEPQLEWAAVFQEGTELDLKSINLAVEKYRYNPTEDKIFLGRGLKDEDRTIVHHFDDYSSSGIVYPDLESGIFLSRKLILDLAMELKNGPYSLSKELMKYFPYDFNIDPSYEFAKFLFREGGDGGTPLTSLDEICATKKKSCFTSYSTAYTSCLNTGQTKEMEALLSQTLVAVKTCAEFHKTRLPVVQETWADLVPNLVYISEKEDPEIPTIHLPYTVNTKTGHCNKTMAIIQHFLEQTDYSYLAIVDDDTILSVARLASLITCYVEEKMPWFLGQRYGFQMATDRGYNYITGGGGMVMNRAGASNLMHCSCQSPSSPDDMHLGLCASRDGLVNVLHSNRMFQARPDDYPSALISYRRPISFHKHWENDPIQVYNDNFLKPDSKLRAAMTKSKPKPKVEL